MGLVLIVLCTRVVFERGNNGVCTLFAREKRRSKNPVARVHPCATIETCDVRASRKNVVTM